MNELVATVRFQAAYNDINIPLGILPGTRENRAPSRK